MFNISEQVLYLRCCHLYHSFCILKWFLQNDVCPTCKKKYNEKVVFNDDIPNHNNNNLNQIEDADNISNNNNIQYNNQLIIQRIEINNNIENSNNRTWINNLNNFYYNNRRQRNNRARIGDNYRKTQRNGLMGRNNNRNRFGFFRGSQNYIQRQRMRRT